MIFIILHFIYTISIHISIHIYVTFLFLGLYRFCITYIVTWYSNEYSHHSMFATELPIADKWPSVQLEAGNHRRIVRGPCAGALEPMFVLVSDVSLRWAVELEFVGLALKRRAKGERTWKRNALLVVVREVPWSGFCWPCFFFSCFLLSFWFEFLPCKWHFSQNRGNSVFLV